MVTPVMQSDHDQHGCGHRTSVTTEHFIESSFHSACSHTKVSLERAWDRLFWKGKCGREEKEVLLVRCTSGSDDKAWKEFGGQDFFHPSSFFLLLPQIPIHPPTHCRVEKAPIQTHFLTENLRRHLSNNAKRRSAAERAIQAQGVWSVI